MKLESPGEIQPSPLGSDSRRTERIPIEIPIRVVIPIRVTSLGGAAGEFCEETRTLTVNRDGALIALKHRVRPDDDIRIVNLENFREADFRVVGKAREEGGESTQWGVECLDRDRNLWEIDFAPATKGSGSKGGSLLQCQGCAIQGLSRLSLTEASILDSSGTLEKLCEKCGELTLWEYVDEARRPKEPAAPVEFVANFKQVSHASASGEVVRVSKVEGWNGGAQRLLAPEFASSPNAALAEQRAGEGRSVEVSSQPWAAEVPAIPPVAKWNGEAEKRQHKRLAMNMPVLVRNRKGENEIARTDNISKGGLGVPLAMIFTLGERVTIVCPYSGSGPQMEQIAEVR